MGERRDRPAAGEQPGDGGQHGRDAEEEARGGEGEAGRAGAGRGQGERGAGYQEDDGGAEMSRVQLQVLQRRRNENSLQHQVHCRKLNVRPSWSEEIVFHLVFFIRLWLTIWR